jgi:hypothetical protein
VNVKKIVLIIFLLLLIATAYMAGSHGPDPTQWFLPPTPTPTFTPTHTATAVYTATPTFTFTFTATATATMTATPVPKKTVKKAPKKIAKKPTPIPKKKAPPPPIVAPELKPICTGPNLPSAVMKSGANNTFSTAQDLSTLTSQGLQVKGTLSKVVHAADTAAADAYKVDPNLVNADLDVDVYTFSTSSPFLAVLDCYSHVVGRPNPLYQEENYHLEIYDGAFQLVGSSNQNNPVESVEISGVGTKFYAVVYGVDGKDGGGYRLTLTLKGSE